MRGEWGGTSGEGALVLRLGGGRSNNCCPAADPAFPTGGLADALAKWLGRSLLGKGGCLAFFGANV